MPIQPETVTSNELFEFITNNKEADPEKALRDFCDFQAALMHKLLAQADVTGLTTTVTGTAGGFPVVGTGVQNGILKLV